MERVQRVPYYAIINYFFYKFNLNTIILLHFNNTLSKIIFILFCDKCINV